VRTPHKILHWFAWNFWLPRVQPLIHSCRSRQIFGGAKDFCPNLLKLARKNFGPLFVLMKTVFRMSAKRKSSCDFRRHFFKPKHIGRLFCSYFQDVCPDLRIFTDFAHSSTDFAMIFTKSKLLGVRLHTRPRHHCFHLLPFVSVSWSFWQNIEICNLCQNLPWSKTSSICKNADDPQPPKNFPRQKDLLRTE